MTRADDDMKVTSAHIDRGRTTTKSATRQPESLISCSDNSLCCSTSPPKRSLEGSTAWHSTSSHHTMEQLATSNTHNEHTQGTLTPLPLLLVQTKYKAAWPTALVWYCCCCRLSSTRQHNNLTQAPAAAAAPADRKMPFVPGTTQTVFI